VYDDPFDVHHSELAKIAIHDCADASSGSRSAEAECNKLLQVAFSADADESDKPK
jgi:hypothetical protein